MYNSVILRSGGSVLDESPESQVRVCCHFYMTITISNNYPFWQSQIPVMVWMVLGQHYQISQNGCHVGATRIQGWVR